MFRFNHSLKKGVGEDAGIDVGVGSRTNNMMGEITPFGLGKEGFA